MIIVVDNDYFDENDNGEDDNHGENKNIEYDNHGRMIMVRMIMIIQYR